MTDELPDEVLLDEETENTPAPHSSRLIQWLIVLGLALLFLPLYLVSTTIKQDTGPLKTQVADLDATLASAPKKSAVEISLNSTLAQIKAQGSALDAVQPTLAASRLDWPPVMAVIGSYDQMHVVLTNIVQTGKTITLTGQATDENAVMVYAQQLKDSPRFTRVIVQGIVGHPSPTPTPTLTPTSTPTPTFTPAPDTTPAATLIPTRSPTPNRVPANAADDLRDKFASFTILLETNPNYNPTSLPTPSATPTAGHS